MNELIWILLGLGVAGGVAYAASSSSSSTPTPTPNPNPSPSPSPSPTPPAQPPPCAEGWADASIIMPGQRARLTVSPAAFGTIASSLHLPAGVAGWTALLQMPQIVAALKSSSVPIAWGMSDTLPTDWPADDANQVGYHVEFTYGGTTPLVLAAAPMPVHGWTCGMLAKGTGPGSDCTEGPTTIPISASGTGNPTVHVGDALTFYNDACAAWVAFASSDETIVKTQGMLMGAAAALAPGTAQVSGGYTDPATGAQVNVSGLVTVLNAPAILTLATLSNTASSPGNTGRPLYIAGMDATLLEVDPQTATTGYQWAGPTDPAVFPLGLGSAVYAPPAESDGVLQVDYVSGGLWLQLSWLDGSSTPMANDLVITDVIELLAIVSQADVTMTDRASGVVSLALPPGGTWDALGIVIGGPGGAFAGGGSNPNPGDTQTVALQFTSTSSAPTSVPVVAHWVDPVAGPTTTLLNVAVPPAAPLVNP
jgi:hypothetical protein